MSIFCFSHLIFHSTHKNSRKFSDRGIDLGEWGVAGCERENILYYFRWGRGALGPKI